MTQSSTLELCNKTADGFDSSVRNMSASFEQTINTTKTMSFYCTVGKHCSAGMFGLVNAAVTTNATSAFDTYMQAYAKR